MSAQTVLVQANKVLPKIPKISIESQRPHTRGDEESCLSPTVRKFDEAPSMIPQRTPSRLPQFQQSRRWARKYGSSPPPPTPPPKDEPQHEQKPVAEPDNRILSMREESFEQQRAELRRFPVTLPNIEEPVNQKVFHDSSPTLQESALCQPVASKCWKSVKATIFITPRGNTPGEHDIRPHSRRATPTKSRERRVAHDGNRVAVPSMARLGAKSTQRRRVAQSENPMAAISTGVDGGYTQPSHETEKENWLQYRAPPSPVLSLHDPEKDSRFSKECMDILKCMDFNRDWMLTPTSGSAGVGPSSHRSHVRQEDPYEKISIQAALACLPATPYPNSPELIPDITITSSSTPKAHVHGVQPSAIHLGKNALSLPASTQSRKSPQAVTAIHKSERTDRYTQGNKSAFRTESLLRMPSSASSMGRSLKSPRPAMSTDTLAKIEAQVRASQPSQLDSNRGHFQFKRLSEPKSDAPPSIPPERPLPALPAEAKTEVFRLSSDSSRGVPRKPVHQAYQRSSISTIRIVGFTDPEDFTSRSPHTSQISVHDGLQSANISGVKTVSLADVSSAASLKSESSRSSTRSYMRHSISGPRAEKVKERRLRDLASSKSDINATTISNQTTPLQRPVSSVHLKGIIPSHSLVPRPSVDPLDQFPDVPESRPTSLASPNASRGHSRAQSQAKYSIHTRHPSKASSNYPQSARPRQILSQSNIFIVVDSDPVTTRFKAGTMSPAPSIGSIHSRSGSPHQQKKHVRRPSNLKGATGVQGSPLKTIKNRTSLHSLKSQVSASARSSQTGVKKNKRAIRSTNRHLSSSSDESHLLIATSTSTSSKHTLTRPKKRRRWNSNDIGHVKTLEQALDYYRSTIMKQEERLRDQADQIQMMIRVIAPMNRARGVKDPSGLSAIMDYSTTEETCQPSHGNISKRSTGVTNSKIPKVSLGSPVRTTGRLILERSNSTGGNSTASTSASASAHTTDATKVSADDASMTDPFEYEPIPKGNTTRPAKLATATVTPSKIGATNAQGSRPATCEKPVSRGDGSGTIVPLHQPPPVAKVIPRGKLPEEMSLLSVSTQGRDHSSNHHTHTLSKDSGLKYRSLNQIARSHNSRHSSPPDQHHTRNPMVGCDDSFDTGVENKRDLTRLSVNHVLTSTEQMDRAIERFMHH